MRASINAVTLVLLLAFPVLLFSCDKSGKDESKENAKAEKLQAVSEKPTGMTIKPSVAGAFYPGDAASLEKEIKKHLGQAVKKDLPGLWGLVAPHAGYRFSGPIAASAFKQAEGKNFSTVVLIAFSHRPYTKDGTPIHIGIATAEADSMLTPLGEIPIDLKAVRELRRDCAFIGNNTVLFMGEHSLEVELPFIQSVLPQAKLVPIMFGWEDNPSAAKALADALYDKFSKRDDVLFVSSTDLSHFFTYEKAKELDRNTAGLIRKLDTKELIARHRSGHVDCCGLLPVLTMLHLQKRFNGPEPQVLDLRNSGDTFGGKDRVVGYAAIAFQKALKDSENAKVTHTKESAMSDYILTDDQKQQLLKIARETVEGYVAKGEKPKIETDDPLFKDLGAAFVTLKEHGDLRGCIGQVEAHMPLIDCIQEMAVAACSQDPRFRPVAKDELDELDYEISVLTPMKKVESVEDVKVGRDGLMMIRGAHRGLLLPQVPVEWEWDRDEFLSQTCVKAGLPEDSWKDGSVDIYNFQALVFSDHDFKK